MKYNLIEDLTFRFSLRIIDLYRHLSAQQEFVLSRQLHRFGTNIGANVAESITRKQTRFHSQIEYFVKRSQRNDVLAKDYSTE